MNYTVCDHISQPLDSGLLVYSKNGNSVHFLEEEAALVWTLACSTSCTTRLKKLLPEMTPHQLEKVLFEFTEADLIRFEEPGFPRREFLIRSGVAATTLVLSASLPASAQSGSVTPTATCGPNCAIAGCASGEQVCFYQENDPAFCTQSNVDGCCGLFGVTFSMVCAPGAGSCPPADGNNSFSSTAACP
ncbi:MAG TPA: hypothetical protein EYO33_14955 [Phycisphaerales bacterium]|nr:hypothetical protein [Phycisphaerales bacterium]